MYAEGIRVPYKSPWLTVSKDTGDRTLIPHSHSLVELNFANSMNKSGNSLLQSLLTALSLANILISALTATIRSQNLAKLCLNFGPIGQ